MKTALCLLSWLCCGWLLGGCPHRIALLPPEERMTGSEEVLRAMRERSQGVRSLRSTGSIEFRRGNNRVKAHTVVLLQRPASLRFETESFFDTPLSILVTNGMDFSLWDMDKGRFVSGAATGANISRAIPVPLDGPDVTGLLFGDPPVIPFAESHLGYDESEGTYVLSLKNSTQQQEIRVDPSLLRPTRVSGTTQGSGGYRITFEEWIEKEGLTTPRKILFEMPEEGLRVVIRASQAELNVDLDGKLFTLTPPEGIEVERFD